MKSIVLAILSIIIFSACSVRQHYEPIDVQKQANFTVNNSSSYIKTLNAKFATLKSNQYIDEDGISNKLLPEGYEFLNNSNSVLLAANKKGNLLFLDSNETITFKENVIAASAQGNIIALLFSNNSIALYDTKEKKYFFKKYYDVTYINDTRIAMPVFLTNIILLPTLSGKVVVVDRNSFKVIRTINIDPVSDVKNIILLEAIKDTLIAASTNKIISIKNGKSFSKELFIQSYVLTDEFVYVARLDGTVVKLDLSLNIINEVKFKFAKIQALVLSEKYLYAVESQDFVIRMNKDLTNSKVYPLHMYEQKIFSKNNILYFDDNYIKFK
jgi:hypothetical protein